MDLLELFFPKNCLECNKKGGYICQRCLNAVSFANTICPICKRFGFYGKTHKDCKSEHSLDGLINIWEYRGVIRKSIVKIKYKFATDVAVSLGKLSEVELRKFRLSKNCIFVPVPLYKSRNNWRGFNQSELLAREISKVNGFKLIPDLLIKKQETDPQVHLSRVNRHTNLKDKFLVNKKYDLQKINLSSQIIIFDDVWTTGSTITEACFVLKKAGFKNVWGMTIAVS